MYYYTCTVEPLNNATFETAKFFFTNYRFSLKGGYNGNGLCKCIETKLKYSVSSGLYSEQQFYQSVYS